jgi:SAM-dependent methyltransferase
VLRGIEAGLINEKIEKIGDRQRILDVGCGSGRFALALNTAIDVGLEPKVDKIELARNNSRYRSLIPASIEDVAGQFEGRFDLVLVNSVLEHAPQLADAIRAIRYVCAPGGYVIATVPLSKERFRFNAAELHRRDSGEFGLAFSGYLDHRNSLTSQDWIRRFTDHGFQLVSAERYLRSSTKCLIDTLSPFNVVLHPNAQARFVRFLPRLQDAAADAFCGYAMPIIERELAGGRSKGSNAIFLFRNPSSNV